MNHIQDIFVWCNSVKEMKKFYTEILGLKEVWSGEAKTKSDYDYVGYKMNESFVLHFLSDNEVMPKHKTWAKQPPHKLGTLKVISWTIGFSEEEYADVIKNLKTAKIESIIESPTWQNGYWGWIVKDPMGNSVYVHMNFEEEPESKIWET